MKSIQEIIELARRRRRIKFIGYLRLTGKRTKYVRVERWE
jgi:hypothetical protein